MHNENVVVNSAGALVSRRSYGSYVAEYGPSEHECEHERELIVEGRRGPKGRSVVILVRLQRTRSLTEVVNFMVNRGGDAGHGR